MAENRLKERWKAGKAAVNGWLAIPSGFSAEVAVALPGDDLDFLTREAGWVSPPAPPANALWTDQRSDILQTIRWLF
jgi:hypothetical protein